MPIELRVLLCFVFHRLTSHRKRQWSVCGVFVEPIFGVQYFPFVAIYVWNKKNPEPQFRSRILRLVTGMMVLTCTEHYLGMTKACTAMTPDLFASRVG